MIMNLETDLVICEPLDSEGNAKVAEVGKKLIMRIKNGYPEKEKSKVHQCSNP